MHRSRVSLNQQALYKTPKVKIRSQTFGRGIQKKITNLCIELVFKFLTKFSNYKEYNFYNYLTGRIS